MSEDVSELESLYQEFRTGEVTPVYELVREGKIDDWYFVVRRIELLLSIEAIVMQQEGVRLARMLLERPSPNDGYNQERCIIAQRLCVGGVLRDEYIKVHNNEAYKVQDFRTNLYLVYHLAHNEALAP